MAIKEVIYTATVIESERGWGQRIDEVREFKTEKARDKFIKEFNSVNTAPSAPDWYMYAEKSGDKIRNPKRKIKAKKR